MTLEQSAEIAEYESEHDRERGWVATATTAL